MQTESRTNSARRKALFIALGVAIAVILVAVAVAVYLRQSATPEEIAAAYVEDNIDEISEEIAGMMVFQAPILSSVVEELGGEYLENLIYDVVQWDYAAEQSAADDIYEVTATSRVSLDLDIAGLVEGSVQASLPFLIIVDMDRQAVRRSSPQLADASFEADLPGLGALSAVNDALAGIDAAASAASKATDALSKISDAVPSLPAQPGDAMDKVADKVAQAVANETAAPAEKSDSLESCVFAALEEELSGVLIEKIEEADPDALTDKQRWEWLKVLEQVSGNYNVVNSCQALWSEPITPENAAKRNDDFYDECAGGLERILNEDSANYRYDEYGLARAADILELLHRPYPSLSLTDRVVLRMLFENSGSCIRYYPQLFLGRWAPFGSE